MSDLDTRYLTVPQVAAELQMDVSAVYKKVQVPAAAIGPLRQIGGASRAWHTSATFSGWRANALRHWSTTRLPHRIS